MGVMPVTTIDQRLAALPTAYIAQQVDSMELWARLTLEAELETNQGGVFSGR